MGGHMGKDEERKKNGKRPGGGGSPKWNVNKSYRNMYTFVYHLEKVTHFGEKVTHFSLLVLPVKSLKTSIFNRVEQESFEIGEAG